MSWLTRSLSGFGLSVALLGEFTMAPAVAAPAGELTEEQLIEKAKKLNSETKTLEEADAKLKALNKDKAGTQKLLKAAAKLQRGAKNDEKPFRYYATLVLAKAAHNLKDYDTAALFYRTCTDIAIDDLQSSEHIIRAVEGHLDFLLARKRYDELEELAQRVIAINGDDTLRQFALIDVMGQLLVAMSRKGQTDKAIEKVDGLIKAFDGNFIFHQMKARILSDAEKYEAAVKAYQAVIDAIQDNENLKKEQKERFIRGTRYAIAGVYVTEDKIDEGTKVLRELVKEDPDNATFKNDLGFIMADHDKNLEESEKLIRDAIALDLKARAKLAEEGKLDKDEAKKANAAYLDSLGWVLYKQKKYEEALKYLLESANQDDEESNSIEIWDHVADCYLALGKKKEALEYYQKALKMEDTSRKDGERRRKVTEKMRKLKEELNK